MMLHTQNLGKLSPANAFRVHKNKIHTHKRAIKNEGKKREATREAEETNDNDFRFRREAEIWLEDWI